MTLKELQRQMVCWQDHNFPGRASFVPLLGVMEELGELSHSFIKAGAGIRTGENHRAQAEDAVGDLLIFLADFCNAVGIDMDEALEQAWVIVSARDWRKFPKNGVNQ